LRTRWEERYSPAEMIYLEVTDRDVRAYLNNNTDSADHWAFEEVIAGAADYMVRPVFGEETLTELKAAARAQLDRRRDL
jgi:hypothetical protein